MAIKTQSKEILPFITADSFSKIKHVSHGLTLVQKRTLLQTLGNMSFILFDHYMYKANAKSLDFSDAKVGKELGFPERTIQRTRLNLTRNNWFYQCNIPNGHVSTIRVVLIGQQSVYKFRKNPKLIIPDLMSKGIELEKDHFNLEEIM